jgi:hypothetical protein
MCNSIQKSLNGKNCKNLFLSGYFTALHANARKPSTLAQAQARNKL